MSEEIIFLSEEELLEGIVSVGGSKKNKKKTSSQKKPASGTQTENPTSPADNAAKKPTDQPSKASSADTIKEEKTRPSKTEKREQPKTATKEVPKTPTQEQTKAAAKEAPKAPKQEQTKAAAKEATKAPKQEQTKAAAKEATKAPKQEQTKAAAKEATKAPKQEQTKAAAKEAPKAPKQEQTKAAAKEAPKAPKQEQTKAAAKEAPKAVKNQGKKPKKRRKNHSAGRLALVVIGRTLICLLVVIGMLVGGLYMVLNLIFNGPSPAARDKLTMSLLEPSATKWIPAIFLGEEQVEAIRNSGSELYNEEATPDAPIRINADSALLSNSDEWKNCPDGIQIKTVHGDTYTGYVMIIRDPSRVYLATSSDHFSMDIPGTRITDQIETEGASAAVNAGAFFDNGTASPAVGSVPEGLVISQGKVVWDSGKAPEEGFVGFNQDNVLVVADSMTGAEAMELGIRDGCCFGPVLMRDGSINNAVYNGNSGFNPRTAIGQRADGAVILLCIDGRQAGSLGGTYADIINVMVEYEAVNACNLDGGSSTVMLYRDPQNGEVQMINNYSLLQEKPRKMPTFIMVRPMEGE